MTITADHIQLNETKVGIVMATYNPNIYYLGKQIQSIKDQSHQNWECVISDDSTEALAQSQIQSLIKDDDRFVYVLSKNSRGVLQNFENALHYVGDGSDFLCFADQDDIWDENKIEKLLQIILPKPTIMLVHSDASIIDEKGDQVCSSLWQCEKRNVKNSSCFDLIVRNNVTGCTMLVRKLVLKSALPFPEQEKDIPYYHDHWVAIHAALLGDVVSCSERLVHYRQHADNVVGPRSKIPLSLLFKPRYFVSESCRQWRFFEYLKSSIVKHIAQPPKTLRKEFNTKYRSFKNVRLLNQSKFYLFSDFVRFAKLTLILMGGAVCRIKGEKNTKLSGAMNLYSDFSDSTASPALHSASASTEASSQTLTQKFKLGLVKQSSPNLSNTKSLDHNLTKDQKSNFKVYHKYLLTKSWKGNIYRKYYLYPLLKKMVKGVVLDIGCGVGDFLQARPQSVGLDINPYNIQLCWKLGYEAHYVPDYNYPFEDKEFDSVMIDNVLEHLEDPAPMLREVNRVLKTGGVALIGVPGIKGFNYDSDHKIYYNPIKLEKTLDSFGFSLDQMHHLPFKNKKLERSFKRYIYYGVFIKQKDIPLESVESSM